jgi:hypothetical protein
VLVVLLELDRWDESDLAGQASMSESVEVLGDSVLEVVDGLPGARRAFARYGARTSSRAAALFSERSIS